MRGVDNLEVIKCKFILRGVVRVLVCGQRGWGWWCLWVFIIWIGGEMDVWILGGGDFGLDWFFIL